MDEHVSDCLVTGYESLIPTLSLPDPNDRHVLAAALHSGAGLIITYNLTDFPAAVLGQFQIEAIHPDEFIIRMWDESPKLVLGAARRQRAGLTRPPKSAAEYLVTLEGCGLSETASRFRQHANEI